MGTELTKVTFPDTNYIDLNHRVSNVAWDSTNKKLTQTLGKTTTDIVTGETILDPLIPVKTASGSLVSFSDGADLPMPSFVCNIDAVQDLHGYDSPWVGGAGKNKLEVTTTTQTVNGVTFTVNSDGTITANGTVGANENINFTVGEFLVDSNSCIVNGVSGGGVYTYYLQIVNEEETAQIGTTFDGDNTISISANTKYKVRIRILSGVTVNNLVFYPMIRLATETDPTFAPYKNICPISGHTGVNAWVRGKNLFDKTSITQNYRVITLNGELEYLSGAYASDYTSVTPITIYTMNFVYYSAANFGMAYYDANKVYISGEKQRTQEGDTSFTFTTPSNCKYIRFTIGSDVSIDNVQLEKGSTATTYEPYNPNSQTIQVSWESEAGEVYGGYVDLVSGVLTVTHKGVNLGDISYYEAQTGVYATNSGLNGIKPPLNNYRIADAISSHYKIVARQSQPDMSIAINNNGRAVIADSNYNNYSTTDFQTAMDGVQLVYELATPITYQLTPTQIKSLLGTNNVWCDTGNVNVKYITQPYDGISAKYSEYAYNAVNKTGDTMTGDLTLYMEGTTTNNYPTKLTFQNKNTTTDKTSNAAIYAYDGGENGANLVIHPTGNMFIGSGESANAHYNLYKHSTAEMFFATADQHMYLQANGQTIANRRGLVINASHEILPCAADVATNKIGSIGNATYKWGSMYTTRFNQIITGSGTAGQDKGSGVSPRYFPAKWTFNTGLTAADGDTFTIKIPVAGHDYGVFMSVDNGTTYYPIVCNGTGRLSTHYPVNSYITVVFEPNGSAASMVPLNGGNTRVTVTGGVWRVINFYDANTNTQVRVYRQTTGYNNDYPLLVSRTLASDIGTAGTNDSYSQVYGVMWNDTTKIPTLNPSTGELKTEYLKVNGGYITVTSESSPSLMLMSEGTGKALLMGPDGTMSCSSTWDGTNVGLKDALANKLSLSGGTLTGWLAFAGSDINLKTTGASSNDSSDIAWWYGNGNEKARIWTDNTYTAKKGLNYRVYKEDGTALYSGRLATLDDVQNYTIATGDTDGTIKVTPTDGTAYEVAVKGFHAPNPMRQFYTTINTGSNFNISTKNARRGYVFIMFNKKTSPDSSNRAIAILPIIQTVMYVPFVVNTSFKSARFEITAESGTNNLLVKFLSISDTNFNIEGVYG